MINNVYKALRSIFSWKKGDCTNEGVKSSQSASEEGESTFKNNVIIPEGVSEPVVSFVRCFRENPKRFRLSCEWCSVECSLNMTQAYFIEDKVGGVKYIYYEWPLQDSFVESIDIKDILTKDEINYLTSTLREVFEARKTRYNEILEQRKQRTQMRLREKLTKIYRGIDYL